MKKECVLIVSACVVIVISVYATLQYSTIRYNLNLFHRTGAIVKVEKVDRDYRSNTNYTVMVTPKNGDKQYWLSICAFYNQVPNVGETWEVKPTYRFNIAQDNLTFVKKVD